MTKAPVPARFGNAVRSHRIAMGYSQDSFADVLKMHRSYYSAIERGEKNLTLETLVRLSEGLGVPLSKLFETAKV